MLYFRWEKVAKRSHTPLEIYPFGARSDTVMINGNVEYVLKDERKAQMEWAAKAHFVQEDGDLKMDFYQVYLVRLLARLALAEIGVMVLTSYRILAPWLERSRSSACSMHDCPYTAHPRTSRLSLVLSN